MMYNAFTKRGIEFLLSGIITVSQHLRRTYDQGAAAILDDCHAFDVVGCGAVTKPTGIRLAEIGTGYQYRYVLTPFKFGDLR